MGKTIEIRLSDAQHAALIAQAAAYGRHLFDHCRMKLMENLTTPALVSLRVPPQLTGGRSTTVQVAETDAPAKVAEFAERLAALPDTRRAPASDNVRMSRIEAMMVEMSQAIHNLANPAYIVEPQQPADPIDVDSLVSAQFAEAEAQGLTEHVPDEAEQQLASSGVRPLSRRPIPFSAHSAPRHLRELG
jgi:hypothetical protein